jgi:hypothetical protein
LEYPLLHSQQLQDLASIQQQQQQQMNPQKYPAISEDYFDLICYITVPCASWHIAIPESSLDPSILWYHEILFVTFEMT